MPEPPQVFISYDRADLNAAERARAHLLANHVRTWMDRYDIRPGAYWPDEIDDALNASEFVLGLLSPDAVASRNVKNEWDWAIQNDKQLILLMTRPCVIPHRYISINFIDATRDLDAALDELTRIPGLRPVAPAFTPPRTRYARSGDVNIAYQVFGEGLTDLVYVPGYISHVEHYWKHPSVEAFLRRLGSLARVIMFDKRGTGMSDRTGRISTMEERMDDIRAVMDAAGSEHAAIMGLSEGVALAILFAATHPQRTQSLILYAGRASYAQQSDYPWMKPVGQQREELDTAVDTLYETWGTAESAREAIRIRAPSAVDDEEVVAWFAELQRLGASPGAEIARQRMNLEIDVRHALPVIRVPTLVLNRVDDRSVLIEEARYIAERIPGATLVELPGDAHLPSAGDQETLFAALGQFLATTADEEPSAEREIVLATIVHLEGDDLDPSALQAAAARQSDRFKGRIVATVSNGIDAMFDGPARAIRYAAAVGAARSGAIGIRAGIQTGEVELTDGGASGPPFDTARQLASLGAPGQILATSTVRDLVAGSGIGFTPAPRRQTAKQTGLPSILIVDRDSLA